MLDYSGYVEATKVNLVNLCDLDTILGLPYVFLMLESINILMKFAKNFQTFYFHNFNKFMGFKMVCGRTKDP